MYSKPICDRPSALCQKPDNVDFLLKSLTDSQENDYDSVPSDEDTDQDLPSSKGDRTKVTSDTQDPFNLRRVRVTTTFLSCI